MADSAPLSVGQCRGGRAFARLRPLGLRLVGRNLVRRRGGTFSIVPTRLRSSSYAGLAGIGFGALRLRGLALGLLADPSPCARVAGSSRRTPPSFAKATAWQPSLGKVKIKGVVTFCWLAKPPAFARWDHGVAPFRFEKVASPPDYALRAAPDRRGLASARCACGVLPSACWPPHLLAPALRAPVVEPRSPLMSL
jgi:hypothetical protein